MLDIVVRRPRPTLQAARNEPVSCNGDYVNDIRKSRVYQEPIETNTGTHSCGNFPLLELREQGRRLALLELDRSQEEQSRLPLWRVQYSDRTRHRPLSFAVSRPSRRVDALSRTHSFRVDHRSPVLQHALLQSGTHGTGSPVREQFAPTDVQR